MRKSSFIISCIALIILTGCNGESFFGIYKGRDIRGARVRSVATKCADHIDSDEELIYQTSIDLGDTTATLSVFISDMPEDFGRVEEHTKVAETTKDSLKNMPFAMRVFDESGNIYVSSDEDLEGATKLPMENVTLTYDGTSNLWNFDNDYYWPIEDQTLTFCSFAPDSTLNATSPAVTNVRIDDGKLLLDYSQPNHFSTDEDGVKANDLLVAMDTQEKGSDGSVWVHFKHALTGVRFRCGDLHNVAVTGISLENFAGSGTMTFTPDDGGDYTKSTITWNPNYTDKRKFSQSFNDANEVGSESKLGKGASMDITPNLDKTFMMIPQKLPDDATIALAIGGNIHAAKVVISNLSEKNVGGGKDLGLSDEEVAKNIEENIKKIKDWSSYAGKIITFQVSLNSNVNSVNVSIEDQIVNGDTKQDIRIKNEGTSPILIRMTMVGNWMNDENQILSSWNEKTPYGNFYSKTTSAAVDFNDLTTLGDYWKKGSEDGIYYYKYCVMPGNTLLHPLFDSFQITGKPSSQNGEWEGQVKMQIDHLELVLLAQAVSAVKTDADGKWDDIVTSYIFDRAIDAWGEFPFQDSSYTRPERDK